MLKRIFSIYCIVVFFHSCSKTIDFTEVKVDEYYELTVPEYLHPCTDLHKNAAVQLQSTDNDIYLIVIDEKKSIIHNMGMYYTLKTYNSTILKQSFLSQIKNVTKDSIPVTMQIGTNKAVITNIKGDVNNQHVFYKLAVIETPASFYQIIVWTRADKKEHFENNMLKIIQSFREVAKTDITTK